MRRMIGRAPVHYASVPATGPEELERPRGIRRHRGGGPVTQPDCLLVLTVRARTDITSNGVPVYQCTGFGLLVLHQPVYRYTLWYTTTRKQSV